jgi:hypothetical protein
MDNQSTNSIREAVASGEFDRATILWNEYATRIREEIRRGTCTAGRMAEAGELVRWSRQVVLCDRARAQAQLNTIWVASRYGPAVDPPSPSCFRAKL